MLIIFVPITFRDGLGWFMKQRVLSDTGLNEGGLASQIFFLIYQTIELILHLLLTL